jgi:hypothetical protein
VEEEEEPGLAYTMKIIPILNLIFRSHEIKETERR